MRLFKISAILIVITFFSITNLKSQTEQNKSKISFGIEGGVQFTNIYDRETYSTLPKTKTGFTSGIFGNYDLSENVKLRLGLYYDKRGFKIEDYLTPISELQEDDSVYVSYASYYYEKLDYSLNYLTIPISLLYSKGNEKFEFFIEGGVYYSILLNASRNGNTELYIYPDHAANFENPLLQIPGSSITNFNNEDVLQYFTGNDWGILLSFGGVYHLNKNIDFQFSPETCFSFENLYANPVRSSKWNRIYRINAGIIYKLN
jgi:hypothetical protein